MEAAGYLQYITFCMIVVAVLIMLVVMEYHSTATTMLHQEVHARGYKPRTNTPRLSHSIAEVSSASGML
jgi:hypothetical protein